MPLFRCTFSPDCTQPSVRRKGSCSLCNRHLCIQHLGQEFHRCPDWEVCPVPIHPSSLLRLLLVVRNMACTLTSSIRFHRQVPEEEHEHNIQSAQAELAEMKALLSRVNIGALRTRASALRNGVECTVSVPDLSSAHNSQNRFSMMGGMNVHIPITFLDGITWLCRIRRSNTGTTTLSHQNQLILSEVATYRFLASRTRIPVPKVYDYGIIGSPLNQIGVGYILMDKLEGKPLSDCDLSGDNWNNVLGQLADIFIALKEQPFHKMGCLLPDGDDFSVGAVLEESSIDTDEKGKLCLLGPFKSAFDYRVACIKHQIELILRGECYTDNAVDAYLIHRFILDHIVSTGTLPDEDNGSFFLKHMDDKGDHILVDEESLRIVGIIDWEWAQTTTQSEAFAAPLGLLDVGTYYSGSNELSREELELVSILKGRGEAGLAECVYGGRVAHRLAHCVGGDTGDTESLPVHFMALRAALGCDEPDETWVQWREGALVRYEKDDELQVLKMRFK
jgi:Phosphotransferase enzyme family